MYGHGCFRATDEINVDMRLNLVYMSLLLQTKEQTTPSLSGKKYYVDVLKGELSSKSTYVPAQPTKNTLLLHHIGTFKKINVKIDKCELTTFYWLPKLHKNSIKYQIIATALILFFHSILHSL